jgi:hypothetical protein
MGDANLTVEQQPGRTQQPTANQGAIVHLQLYSEFTGGMLHRQLQMPTGRDTGQTLSDGTTEQTRRRHTHGAKHSDRRMTFMGNEAAAADSAPGTLWSTFLQPMLQLSPSNT